MARSCLPLSTIRCKQLTGNVKTPLSPSAVTPNLVPSGGKSNLLFSHNNGPYWRARKSAVGDLTHHTCKCLAFRAAHSGGAVYRAQYDSNVTPYSRKQLPRELHQFERATFLISIDSSR